VDSCTLIPPICPFWGNKSSKDLSLPRCFETLPSNEFHKRSSTTTSCRHFVLDTQRQFPYIPTKSEFVSINLTSDLQGRVKEKGIELIVAHNLPTISCDGQRIYQVFQNLLVNAIKFMGDTESPQIEIGYADMGDFHQFSVRDNGIGIDPKYHRRIFEIFHRLKKIEDEEGTGLGLAIVDRIVSNHYGKVWVESEKGKGATFYFTLPKDPSPVRHHE